METAIALIAVAIAVVAIVYGAAVLSRRSPAALSEEHGHPQPDDVVERPAGPGAEPMGVDDTGPTVSPHADGADAGRAPRSR